MFKLTFNFSQEKHELLLQLANDYVRRGSQKRKNDRFRLGYHITAPINWINDPNGLIHYKDEYHIFFQHHPYNSEWGPMHWGHVKSKDLVHWEHLPIALAPSENYDIDGIFSGSAIEKDGKIYVFYTGHVDDKSPKEVQCIAISNDGINFRKADINPIIKSPPHEGSEDFRDPKVWEEDGKWKMVIGSGKDCNGVALLYESDDLLKWEYIGVLADGDYEMGSVWECPDFFQLGDKHILIVSPMEMDGHKNLYIVGELDKKNSTLKKQFYKELDYGSDFYAATTFLDDYGRRIMFAWMNMWDTEIPTQRFGWAGALTVPRELKLNDQGELLTVPVNELKGLRTSQYKYEGKKLNGLLDTGIKGQILEIRAKFRLTENKDSTRFGIKVRSSTSLGEETVVTYDLIKNELIVDKRRSGIGKGGVNYAPLAIEDSLELTIFLDRSSIEVFANEGEVAISNRIYPDEESNGIKIFSDGPVQIEDFTVWELKDIWET